MLITNAFGSKTHISNHIQKASSGKQSIASDTGIDFQRSYLRKVMNAHELLSHI